VPRLGAVVTRDKARRIAANIAKLHWSLKAVFPFVQSSEYDMHARRIGPRHPNRVSGTKMQASAGMEGPLRANLHERGLFNWSANDGPPLPAALVAM
jgi:hypothetical protein